MTEDKVEVSSVSCSVGSTEPASTEEVPAEVKDPEVEEKSEVLSVADTEEVPGAEELPGGSSAEVKDPEIEEKSEVLSVADTEETCTWWQFCRSEGHRSQREV